jgi:hypothetical protein
VEEPEEGPAACDPESEQAGRLRRTAATTTTLERPRVPFGTW